MTLSNVEPIYRNYSTLNDPNLYPPRFQKLPPTQTQNKLKTELDIDDIYIRMKA